MTLALASLVSAHLTVISAGVINKTWTLLKVQDFVVVVVVFVFLQNFKFR